MSKRQFKPRLIPTLATLILFPILVSLGIWQIHRAKEKEQIQTMYQQRGQLPAIDITQHVPNDIESVHYRRAVVTGTFDTAHQILLDNKVHNQVVGYEVLTPLIINANTAVLVNRGWIRGGTDRRVLPKFETPTGRQKINGVISIPSSKLVHFSDYNRDASRWPAVYQWIDFKDMQQATKLPLLPFTIREDPHDPHGFVREWAKVNLLPERSISYAVQWFVMAIVLIIIYIGVNYKKVEQDSDE